MTDIVHQDELLRQLEHRDKIIRDHNGRKTGKPIESPFTLEGMAADEIIQLRQENARLRSLTEWRTIDSAPKDGTMLLLVSTGVSTWHGYFAAYWASGVGEWKFHVNGVVPNPTHWLPLPPPPQTKSE